MAHLVNQGVLSHYTLSMTDYEDFGGYSLYEYAQIATAHSVACFIAEFPDFEAELLTH